MLPRTPLNAAHRRNALRNLTELVTSGKAKLQPAHLSWLQTEAVTSRDRAEKAIAANFLGWYECQTGRGIAER